LYSTRQNLLLSRKFPNSHRLEPETITAHLVRRANVTADCRTILRGTVQRIKDGKDHSYKWCNLSMKFQDNALSFAVP
jgi:hypothetical protein